MTEESNEGRPIQVIRDGQEWIVKNDGDSASLFRSVDKKAAIKFASEMAEQHGIEMIVEEEERSADKDGNHEPELKERDLLVYREDGKWIVSHEGDTAVLFTAADKNAALKFAKDMAEVHGIKLKES